MFLCQVRVLYCILLHGGPTANPQVEALGDADVLENLKYILHLPAGSSDRAFQNG